VGSGAHGRRALAAPDQEAFDVATLELQAPGIGSVRAALFVRARCPEIHLISPSAIAGDGHGSRAIAAGFDIHLIKTPRFATISAAQPSCLPSN
jgi:CheY-like chemotaxis protein